ncbi:MAG: GntR family transcriptional regulator [Pirellulales bacterium]
MQPATLMEQVYRDLRAKVELGELAPGSQLVNRTLCKELGVSTIPLREAIQRLTSEGLVNHIPNAGAFVRRIDRRELLQLFELRNWMELFALERAAARIDEDHLEQLEYICTKWRQMAHAMRDSDHDALKGDDNRTWIGLDIKFHNILIEVSGNVWLKKVAEDLRIMSRIAISKPEEMKLGRAARNCRIHAGIVRGLRRRDLALANYWMERHNSFSLAFAKEMAVEA